MITDRDFAILSSLVRYYVLSRSQIQRLCFPQDKEGRITRRRLQSLLDHKLINRHPVPIDLLSHGSTGPAYFPARLGIEYVAAQLKDERILGVACQQPQAHHLRHWLAVTETHLVLDAALSQQTAVECRGWFNEWDLVNPQVREPEQRYRIFSLLREAPRLVCAPDAAFLLSITGISKVFYLEQDRETAGARQVAASKGPGYAMLAETKLHRRHFPDALLDSFSVLMIVPSASRRDVLRKAFHGKPGAELWKFIALTDLSTETFLHAPIVYPCEGEPRPLVKTDN
jgi:hypothetical protein